jgi:hypothetical protein
LAVFAQEPWGVGALASTLSLAALVIALIVFKETRDPSNKAEKEFFSLARTREVLAMPTVGALVLIYFLAIFAFANFEATLALLTRDALGMTADRDNFLVFAFVGAVLTFAGGAYRPFAKKGSEVGLLTFGVGAMIVGLALVGAVAFLAARPDARGAGYLTRRCRCRWSGSRSSTRPCRRWCRSGRTRRGRARCWE